MIGFTYILIMYLIVFTLCLFVKLFLNYKKAIKNSGQTPTTKIYYVENNKSASKPLYNKKPNIAIKGSIIEKDDLTKNN